MNEPKTLTIVFDFLIPGMNGRDGLMRSHWTGMKTFKNKLKIIILSQKNRVSFKGCVSIEWVRYTTMLMDWDNHCASFKHVGDSLVDCGIIKDDKPSVIVSFLPNQVKARKHSEQKCVCIIKELKDETNQATDPQQV